MNRIITYLLCLAAISVVIYGCKVSYSFTGGSIAKEIKTVSISYFPNNAPMVSPILSSTMTDALKERFSRQTKLTQVREGGDLNFEGEITNYTSTPASISGEQERALTNRLTITVRVRFTNRLQPELNYSKTFSRFLDYPSSQLLQTAEPSLIPEIVSMLVDDIFNAATANW